MISYFLFLVARERLVFVCLGSGSSSLDSSWFSNISGQVIISLVTFLSLNVICKTCGLVCCHIRPHAIVFVDGVDQFLFIAFLIALIWSSHSFCDTLTLGFHRWCNDCAIFMLPDCAVIFSVRFVHIILVFVEVLYLLSHHAIFARNKRVRCDFRWRFYKVTRHGCIDEVLICQTADVWHWSCILTYLSGIFYSNSLCSDMRWIALREVSSCVYDNFVTKLHLASPLFDFFYSLSWQTSLAWSWARPTSETAFSICTGFWCTLSHIKHFCHIWKTSFFQNLNWVKFCFGHLRAIIMIERRSNVYSEVEGLFMFSWWSMCRSSISNFP